MARRLRSVGALLILLPMSIPGALGSDPPSAPDVDEIQEAIRARVEAAGFPVRLAVAGRSIYAERLLPSFYESRAYRPAWVRGRGLGDGATELLATLERASRHGLDPADYHAGAVRELARRVERIGADFVPLGTWVDLELLLTDAFLTYGAHLADGRVDPLDLAPDWIPSRRNPELAGILEDAVSRGRVGEALEGQRPPHAVYDRMVAAYDRVRRVARSGGWPAVPEGATLAPGDTADRVPALRRRLAATGELSEAPGGAPAVYDSTLARAVRLFQHRHGLEDDAVVGPATLEALNVPASERARQLRLNLERWRWLPDSLGTRHVRVNIADYELEVVEEGRVVLAMRAIVGRPYRRTPTFSDRITYLVFNPYWQVPHTLAVQDQLPLIKKEPGYLQRMGFQVFQGWGADGRAVDPATIDWSGLSPRNFPYRLRQDPGPQNALGRVKFMFPNRFSVYLHDTPARELFAKRARGFSSGCIRLERAGELAEYLLRGDPRWTPEAVRRSMTTGTREETVRLPSPVPVHLYYMTAWADADGTIQYRPDVYGRDPALDAALGANPPEPDETPRMPVGASDQLPGDSITTRPPPLGRLPGRVPDRDLSDTEHLKGGLWKYRRTSNHPPFIHVDTRGFIAR